MTVIEHFTVNVVSRRDDRETRAERGAEFPFVTVTIRPLGWRAAWAVLRGRYEAELRVSGTKRAVEAVKALVAAQHEAWYEQDIASVNGRLDAMLARDQRPVGPCAQCGEVTMNQADTSGYEYDSGFLCEAADCVAERPV